MPQCFPTATLTFAPRLIAWQRHHGRHDLPWQRTHDPYRIWLSEIMLQQTQVSTVIPYYTRFIERFPDIFALASAPLDEVMALWSGLGYYSRARNLHRCAQVVVAEYDGRFPSTAAMLAKLPGIGRSTAAAVAAFAFSAREAILDGNVKRVLTRIFGIEGFPGDPQVENTLWTLAESLLPTTSDIGPYTQGLMDLGAMLCVRTRPNCAACPFQQVCVAHTTGREHTLPHTRPKRVLPTRRTLMLVLSLNDGDGVANGAAAILFEKRPPTGIWGGLWSLPEAADEAGLAAYAARFGATGPFTMLTPITHIFTHFRLIIEPRFASISKAAQLSVADANHAWLSVHNMDDYGLPTPVRRLISRLHKSRYFSSYDLSMSNEDISLI